MIFNRLQQLFANQLLNCDFHGTKAFKENRSVNLKKLDFVQRAEVAVIIFFMANDAIVKWQFDTIEARDAEYTRILEIITSAHASSFF